jgi:hypothetical protein
MTSPENAPLEVDDGITAWDLASEREILRVAEFLRAWYQFHVHAIGQIGMPVAGSEGESVNAEEDDRDGAGDGPRRNRATWAG